MGSRIPSWHDPPMSLMALRRRRGTGLLTTRLLRLPAGTGGSVKSIARKGARKREAVTSREPFLTVAVAPESMQE
jgi:hypothetical protein